MIKRLLSGATTSVVSAAVIVGVFSMLSRFVGLLRDHILAGAFGAGDTLDAYYAAFRIPDLLFQLIVTGALSACFIPIFTKYYGQQDEKAWRYANLILNLITVVFLVVSALGILFADVFTPFIFPGFTPEKQAVAAEMSRILFIGQLFFSVSMVFGSVLQGAKRFLLFSFAPILNNVGIIAGLYFFVPMLGVTGLAWGAVLGAAMHALIQSAGVYALGYRYEPIFDWSDKDVRQTIKQTLPRMLGLAVNQVNFLIMTALATLLAAGSVTVLQFAYNLNFFPIGVIGVSYAIAAFPTFSEFVNAREIDKLRSAFSTTVRQVMFFIIPITVITLLLRAQIVRLAYGAGVFDWVATILTADTLAMFAVSFFAQCLVFVLVRMYFAYQDTWTPFVVGVIAAAINIICGIMLAPTYGVPGLAWSFSLSALVQLALLWSLLRSKTGSLDEAVILRSTIILSFAGLAAAAMTQIMKGEVVDFIELDTTVNVLTQTVIAGGAGLLIYFVTAFMMGSPEMMAFTQGIRRKLIRTAKPAEPAQQEMV